MLDQLVPYIYLFLIIQQIPMCCLLCAGNCQKHLTNINPIIFHFIPIKMLWGRYYISLPFYRWENYLQRGCVLCLVTQCLTLCNPMDCSPLGSSVHADSPGKNTGVGCPALLQGIFPTQKSNPGLLHCRWILYCVNHQRSPDFLWLLIYFCLCLSCM